MTAALNDASFQAWMALHARPGPGDEAHVERGLAWIEELLRRPGVNPNAQLQGQTLLMLACQNQEISSKSNNLGTRDEGDRIRARPTERLAHTLLLLGADPWLTSPRSSEGLSPVGLALRWKSDATLVEFLKHPKRPNWETFLHDYPVVSSVGQHPSLVKALSLGGMPPDTVDMDGRNLLFFLTDPNMIAWAVAHGFDPHWKNHQGQTPLDWQEANQMATTETRKAWVTAMGAEHIAPDFIWKQALLGGGGKVRPLFAKSQDQLAWRWQPPGIEVTVNLLDAAALAAIHHPLSVAHDKIKAETGLLRQLLKLSKAWPQESLELAELALRSLTAGQLSRMGGRPTLGESLDLSRGLKRFVTLSPLRPEPRTEQFRIWATLRSDDSWQHEVMDRWVERLQRVPELWAHESSLTLHTFDGFSNTPLTFETSLGGNELELCLPRHRIAVAGQMAVAYGRTDPQVVAITNVQRQKAAHQALDLLQSALDVLGQSLDEPEWAGLKNALRTADLVHDRVVAMTRQQRHRNHDHETIANKPRSRPRP